MTLHGEDCTIRILDQGYRILDIEQLGMEPEMQEQLLHMIRSPSGLLLVTGPTESGKSTRRRRAAAGSRSIRWGSDCG